MWADSNTLLPTPTSRYFSSPARNDDALNLCSTLRHATQLNCGNYCRWAACQPGATSTPTPPVESCLSQTHSRISLQHPSIYLRYSSSSSSTPRPPSNAGSTSPCSSFTLSSPLLADTCNFPFFFYSLTPSLPVRPPSSRHPRPTDIISVRPAPGVPCSDLATRHQGNLRFSALLSPSRFALRAL